MMLREYLSSGAYHKREENASMSKTTMTEDDVIGTVKGGKSKNTYKVYRNPDKSVNGFVGFAGISSVGRCTSDKQAISKAESYVREY